MRLFNILLHYLEEYLLFHMRAQIVKEHKGSGNVFCYKLLSLNDAVQMVK